MTATEQQDQVTETLRALGAVLDHVAHAVPSIAAVLPLYRDLLGGTAYAVGLHPIAHHAAAHVSFPGGGKIELLEPTSDHSLSIGGFLEGHPRGGLHHITFRVTSLDDALAALTQAGYTPFGTNAVHDDWKETFLHPTQTGGVLIQVAQTRPGFPPPLEISVEEMLREAAAVRAALARDPKSGAPQ